MVGTARITVVNALNSAELLPETAFDCDSLVRHVKAVLGHRPIRPVTLFSSSTALTPLDDSFQVVGGDVLTFTAVLGSNMLSDEDRAAILRSIDAIADNSVIEFFRSLDEAARDDAEIVYQVVVVRGASSALQYASSECRDTRDIIYGSVMKDPNHTITFAGPKCRDDHEIVLRSVQTNPQFLELAGEVCKNNREIVLTAIRHDPMNLRFAGSVARDDRELLGEALAMNPNSLQFAGDVCKNDAEIVLGVLKKSRAPALLKHAGSALQSNQEFLLNVLKKLPKCLEHVSPQLETNQEFVLKAVERNANCLKFLSFVLEQDHDFIQEARAVARDTRRARHT